MYSSHRSILVQYSRSCVAGLVAAHRMGKSVRTDDVVSCCMVMSEPSVPYCLPSS